MDTTPGGEITLRLAGSAYADYVAMRNRDEDPFVTSDLNGGSAEPRR